MHNFLLHDTELNKKLKTSSELWAGEFYCTIIRITTSPKRFCIPSRMLSLWHPIGHFFHDDIFLLRPILQIIFLWSQKTPYAGMRSHSSVKRKVEVFTFIELHEIQKKKLNNVYSLKKLYYGRIKFAATGFRHLLYVILVKLGFFLFYWVIKKLKKLL